MFSKRGEARWFPPFKHTVENLGDVPYDGVYIGVRSKAVAAGVKTAPPTTEEVLENLWLTVALEHTTVPATGLPPASR